MAAFSEELVVDVSGVPLALATLTGACTAGELSLASDSVPFGTVVLGSRTSKAVALANTGDVGVKFGWDTRALGPHFAIVPAGGSAWWGWGLSQLDATAGHAIHSHAVTPLSHSATGPSRALDCSPTHSPTPSRFAQRASFRPGRTSSWRWCSSRRALTPTSAWSACAAGAGNAGWARLRPGLRTGRVRSSLPSPPRPLTSPHRLAVAPAGWMAPRGWGWTSPSQLRAAPRAPSPTRSRSSELGRLATACSCASWHAVAQLPLP
jgi:hypothetical protein